MFLLLLRVLSFYLCSDAAGSKYDPVGKLGVAILGAKVSHKFQLILYYSNQQPLATINIRPDFSYSVCSVITSTPFIYTLQTQPGNYGSFYDSTRQNWSILFDNSEDANKFAIHVAIAKFAANPESTWVTLDTVVGKGKV